MGLIACLFLYFPIRDWWYPNYIAIGFQARKHGDLTEAERSYRRAVDQGGNDEYMAISLEGLGRTFLDMQRYPEAEQMLGRAAELHLRLAKSGDPDSVWVRLACDAMEDLGTSQVRQGKTREGMKNYVSGLEVEQKLRGYRLGVEKPLFAAKELRRLREYRAALD
jgi:hypothetical protein